jgi:predicted MFS family arabinose efflux permease
MRIGGQLADQWGSRWLVVVGAVSQAVIMGYLGLLPGTAALSLIVAGLVVHGLGAGVYLAALHRSAMSRIDQDQIGVAAGLYSMIRFGGRTLGAVLGGVLLQQGLDRALPVVAVYQMLFWFIAGVSLLGAVIGWGLRE